MTAAGVSVLGKARAVVKLPAEPPVCHVERGTSRPVTKPIISNPRRVHGGVSHSSALTTFRVGGPGASVTGRRLCGRTGRAGHHGGRGRRGRPGAGRWLQPADQRRWLRRSGRPGAQSRVAGAQRRCLLRRQRAGRSRPGLGRLRRALRGPGVGRGRGALRDSRRGRLDADPERRRLRPGGGADDRVRSHLGPGREPAADVRAQPTAASATGTHGSRPTRPATSCWTSLSSSNTARCRRRSRYTELARTLGVQVGQRAPLPDVRKAVIGLRRGKGMVLDADDHDTWSAGSFFTNPVVPDDFSLFRTGLRGLPPTRAAIKTSAAWLIEHAGFGKGYGLPGPASLSTKHTLALTNRGAATAADLLAPGAYGAGRRRAGLRATAGQRAGSGRRAAIAASHSSTPPNSVCLTRISRGGAEDGRARQTREGLIVETMHVPRGFILIQ